VKLLGKAKSQKTVTHKSVIAGVCVAISDFEVSTPFILILRHLVRGITNEYEILRQAQDDNSEAMKKSNSD